MNSLARYFFISMSLCLPLAYADAAETHWAYQGNHGPKHWGEFASALCSSGTQQSPIDVEMKQVQLQKGVASDFTVNYKKSSIRVQNNGHTIQANVNDGGTANFKGDEYTLVQYHFHTPSEHQINQMPYPMEMHLVHQDSHGRLLVLAILIKEGEQNEQLASLWKQLPAQAGAEITVEEETAPTLDKLVPASSHHLYYKGSLTTPPCTEGVQWVLFEQPVTMSTSQIHEFRTLFPENHRPLQPANQREIDED